MREYNNLLIESTSKTPQIDFNNLTGDLILSGRSVPENATELYEPLFLWVNEYVKKAKPITNLRLNLEYFNTASSIWLAKIVKSLSKIKNSDSVLFIHLYFNVEEYDSMETEDLRDALSPVIDIINTTKISIGVKIYGTNDNGDILKESLVLV